MRPLAVLAAAAAGAVVAILLIDDVIMPLAVGHGRTIEVPDLAEMELEEAEAVLAEKGLSLVVGRQEKSQTVPAGCIISQKPGPFIQVKRARRIYVVVSEGAERLAVPNLVGKSIRQAKLILEQTGFRLGLVYWRSSDSMPKDVVISHSPRAGRQTNKGSAVSLIVSLGVASGSPAVPGLTGKSLKTAQSELEALGVSVGEITYRAEPHVLPGTVLDQIPAPGTALSDTTRVDLVVSKLE